MPPAKRNARHRLMTLLMGVFLLIMLFSLWQIARILWGYHAGQKSYETLRSEVAAAPSSGAASGTAEAWSAPRIDFDRLLEQYPMAVGWLACADTALDYPVMQADDNAYFLRRLPDGTWNMSGSLFLDYRNPGDFSGALSIIYGHNMNDGSMFSCLENYRQQDWYDAHPVLTLQTPQACYALEVLYGFSILARDWQDLGFADPANCAALIDYAAAHTTFTGSASWDQSAPLTALITCATRDDQQRYVLLCAMRPV